jgi:hypothetical protein
VLELVNYESEKIHSANKDGFALENLHITIFLVKETYSDNFQKDADNNTYY